MCVFPHHVGALFPYLRNLQVHMGAKSPKVGPGTKPAAAPQRHHGGHLQTFKSTTSGEHTKQVDTDEDEPDARGTRHGVLSEGSRTGSSGTSLFY